MTISSHSHTSHQTRDLRLRASPVGQVLLQIRVLGFGLLQDGDVGIGVFPGIEEILIAARAFAVSPCNP